MTIRVFQGEREMAADNKVLGNFDLTGLPACTARHAANRSDIRHRREWHRQSVQAKDKATGKEQQIRIQSSGGLSEAATFKKMVKEAEANAGADKNRRAFIEAKNHADALIHQLGAVMAEHGATLSAKHRSEADDAIAAARTAMERSDHDRLTKAADRMSQAVILIEQAAETTQQTRASPGGKQGEKVVDAEFEEVAH